MNFSKVILSVNYVTAAKTSSLIKPSIESLFVSISH